MRNHVRRPARRSAAHGRAAASRPSHKPPAPSAAPENGNATRVVVLVDGKVWFDTRRVGRGMAKQRARLIAMVKPWRRAVRTETRRVVRQVKTASEKWEKRSRRELKRAWRRVQANGSSAGKARATHRRSARAQSRPAHAKRASARSRHAGAAKHATTSKPATRKAHAHKPVRRSR